METLKIIGLSLGSITVLFILTKIVGQREMSGLSIFDFTKEIYQYILQVKLIKKMIDNSITFFNKIIPCLLLKKNHI